MNTEIYKNEKHVRSEKLMTLREYVSLGRLSPGQCLSLGEVGTDEDNRSYSTNSEELWVGHCTPALGPSANDDFWWPNDLPIMKKFVLEVNTY